MRMSYGRPGSECYGLSIKCPLWGSYIRVSVPSFWICLESSGNIRRWGVARNVGHVGLLWNDWSCPQSLPLRFLSSCFLDTMIGTAAPTCSGHYENSSLQAQGNGSNQLWTEISENISQHKSFLFLYRKQREPLKTTDRNMNWSSRCENWCGSSSKTLEVQHIYMN